MIHPHNLNPYLPPRTSSTRSTNQVWTKIKGNTEQISVLIGSEFCAWGGEGVVRGGVRSAGRDCAWMRKEDGIGGGAAGCAEKGMGFGGFINVVQGQARLWCHDCPRLLSSHTTNPRKASVPSR
jgi:hypothetical protein